MKAFLVSALLAIAATPLAAQEHRELGPHEHGVGQLNLAVESSQISIDFRVPGMDIVGFEHQAQSAADKEALQKAIAALSKPLDMFVLPAGAGCSVKSALAALVPEQHQDGDDDHIGHMEFHAAYALACRDTAAVDRIGFEYFRLFPNTRRLVIQLLNGDVAKRFEVGRDAPLLDLGAAE